MELKFINNIKDDKYYIEKMLEDISFIIKNTKDLNIEDLNNNEILCDSMMFRLIQISENSNQVSKEFKDHYIDIPWRAMKGLRNRIVHDYGDVDLTIVYDTLIKDIPKLNILLKNNLRS